MESVTPLSRSAWPIDRGVDRDHRLVEPKLRLCHRRLPKNFLLAGHSRLTWFGELAKLLK